MKSVFVLCLLAFSVTAAPQFQFPQLNFPNQNFNANPFQNQRFMSPNNNNGQCPKNCGYNYNPVCGYGYNSNSGQKFPNECALHLHECENGFKFREIRQGECPQLG